VAADAAAAVVAAGAAVAKPRVLLVAPRDSYRTAPYIAAARGYGIRVVPLFVQFGPESYQVGVDLTTVDLAPQRAQDLIHEYSLRVVPCDVEREVLPFTDRSFATIALCATFEHLRVDPIFALEEMRRVLEPGGLLYLTTPNLYRLGNIASFALGRGLAFDPIREYGKLRSVGHMTCSRVHRVGDSSVLGASGLHHCRSCNASDAESAGQTCGRSATAPAGNEKRASRDRPCRAYRYLGSTGFNTGGVLNI
jgi:SAM-dependent methyltransferase